MADNAYPQAGGGLKTFGPTKEIADTGLQYQPFRGKRYPPFIDVTAAKRLMAEWETTEDDILICTHQKVGTHLTKKFVVELLRVLYPYPEGSAMANGDIGHGTIPWPEVMASQHSPDYMRAFIERTAGLPRVWYTHCCREDLPIKRIHPKTRFIIVVRDPRAAFISQFHFYKAHPLLGCSPDLTFEQLAPLFVKGQLYFGGYHEHAVSWMNKARQEIPIENALFLRYEELVENKVEAARALARFLAPDKALDEATLERVVAATGFQSMKKELAENPQSFHFNPQVFFRRGQTDEWRYELSPELIAAIDEKSMRVWGNLRVSGPDWGEFPSLTSQRTAPASALTSDVAQILDRDLGKLAEEVEGIPDDQLWQAMPGVINSAGAIAYHLCGNLRHFVGGLLGDDGYVRQLDREFTTQVPKAELLAEINLTRAAVAAALAALPASRLAEPMPGTPPHHAGRSVGYFLVQLCCHFERHWGQLNYSRRIVAAAREPS